MPNHCTNRLLVRGPESGVRAFFKKAKGEDGSAGPLTFHAFVPMPDYVLRGDVKAGETRPNWYDWSCDNWGTKWDAYDTYYSLESATPMEQLASALNSPNEQEIEELLAFNTAWSPPIPVVRAMIAQHTDLCFELNSAEPGNDFGVIIEGSGGKTEIEEEFNLSSRRGFAKDVCGYDPYDADDDS